MPFGAMRNLDVPSAASRSGSEREAADGPEAQGPSEKGAQLPLETSCQHEAIWGEKEDEGLHQAGPPPACWVDVERGRRERRTPARACAA